VIVRIIVLAMCHNRPSQYWLLS